MQVEPKAGHWVRRIAVRALSPWPGLPQKQQMALPGFGGLPSMWGGLVPRCGGLWAVWFGGCCSWWRVWRGGTLLSPIATGQGVLLICAVIEGIGGGCCDGYRGPFTCGPHLDEADRLMA